MKRVARSPRIAVVTGGNRGLGLEVCRQLAAEGFTVVLGARETGKGQAAARSLDPSGERVMPERLDVDDEPSLRRAADSVAQRFGHVDVLVNNAAIHYDAGTRGTSADLRIAHEALETNLFGAWRMCQLFLPLLRKSAHGRIVNVSSQAGSLASMGGGTPAYAVSKAALNALTCVLAGELRAARILVNAVCPGWTATDMGGSGGRPVAEGARSILWAALLPDDGPTGGFFRDGRPLDW